MTNSLRRSTSPERAVSTTYRRKELKCCDLRNRESARICSNCRCTLASVPSRLFFGSGALVKAAIGSPNDRFQRALKQEHHPFAERMILYHTAAAHRNQASSIRSEERRVGKECRSR